MLKTLLLLITMMLSWCAGNVTQDHHDTAFVYGGQVHGALAMDCAPVFGLLYCEVFRSYDGPVEIWCNHEVCVRRFPGP